MGLPAKPRTWLAGAAFLVAFLSSTAIWGLPLSRDRIFLWLLAALLALSFSDVRWWARSVVVDWLPVFVVLIVYDRLRGSADSFFEAHVYPQLRFDEIAFGGTAPTVTLQRMLYDHGQVHWYDTAAWIIYVSHFFVTLAVAAVMWKLAYHRFRRFMVMFLTLTMAGYATYVLAPAVPPWLASEHGALEPTYRIIGYVWAHLGVDIAASVWIGGSEYSNDVAALPSLHAAYPMLLLIFFWTGAGRAPRALLVSYCVLMGAVLVYTAEHYVSDILLGWLYAVGTFAVVDHVWRGRGSASPSVGARSSLSD